MLASAFVAPDGRRTLVQPFANAEMRDVPALLQLQETSFISDYATKRTLRRYLNKAGGINIISRDGDIATSCTVSSFQPQFAALRLYILAVHPSYRGGGLGSQVLRALLERAQANGIRTVSLEVAAENHVAIRLYESLGFVGHHILKSYYSNGSDAFRMKLRLASSEMVLHSESL